MMCCPLMMKRTIEFIHNCARASVFCDQKSFVTDRFVSVRAQGRHMSDRDRISKDFALTSCGLLLRHDWYLKYLRIIVRDRRCGCPFSLEVYATVSALARFLDQR